MALKSTQPLTEMSTKSLPEGKGRPARKADNLTTICEPIAEKMLEPQSFAILWAFMACYRDSVTFSLFIGCQNRSSLTELDVDLVEFINWDRGCRVCRSPSLSQVELQTLSL
jgi:hypothetical protein